MKGAAAGSTELFEARDGIAVGRLGRPAEDLDETALDLLAHDVLPAACLVVHVLPLEADDVGEQTLGEAVLAHDVHGLAAAVRG